MDGTTGQGRVQRIGFIARLIGDWVREGTREQPGARFTTSDGRTIALTQPRTRRVSVGVCVADSPVAAAGPVFRDVEGVAAYPEMIPIAAGSFCMGSVDGSDDERPRRKVTFDKPFAVGRTEVTFAQWDACVADGGCQGPESTTEGTGP